MLFGRSLQYSIFGRRWGLVFRAIGALSENPVQERQRFGGPGGKLRPGRSWRRSGLLSRLLPYLPAPIKSADRREGSRTGGREREREGREEREMEGAAAC